MTDSRNKGASAERELAALIHERLGVRLKRNLEQSRNGGHDLIAPDIAAPAAATLESFAIECKRYRATSAALVAKWWLQATQQAQKAGKVPVLAYRADWQPWRVVVPLAAVNCTFQEWEGIEWTAELSLDGFCALVREATT